VPGNGGRRSLLGLQGGDDGEVLQRGGVAFDVFANGDLLKKTAHDLAGPGLGKRIGEMDLRADPARQAEHLTEITAYATALVMTHVTKGKFIQP